MFTAYVEAIKKVQHYLVNDKTDVEKDEIKMSKKSGNYRFITEDDIESNGTNDANSSDSARSLIIDSVDGKFVYINIWICQ